MLSPDEDHGPDRRNAIVRYRERLPVPRYWLRRTGFVALLTGLTIAGANGALPTLPGMWTQASEKIAAMTDRNPDRILLRMVADGEIRPARQSDIDQWLAAARLSEHERRNLSLYTDFSFVVLKPITLPSNMYGANSRAFLIPAAVQVPQGKMAHNTYFFLENGTCLGALCPH